MKLLITGASSYVGARLYFDLSKDFDTVGTYFNNSQFSKLQHLDVTSKTDVEEFISKIKPDYIVHVAANANSRWCEANPELAYKLNETSTKNIVNAANKINAKIIFISSFAAIEPNNVYGKTKHMSEKYVKETKSGYIILRPSLIIGYSPNTVNDRPFNRILKNLDEKTKPIYDTSWKFQPTYLRHISEIIKAVIDNNISKETILVAVPELKSRFDLAHDILKAFGIKAIPEDKHDTTNSSVETLNLLKQLKLPTYTYNEIIEKIIEEIKNRKQFVLK